MAEKDSGGLGDLVGKAKDLLGSEQAGQAAGKAKEFLTDERIDQVASTVKKVTPDSVDRAVDGLAEKAKGLNGD